MTARRIATAVAALALVTGCAHGPSAKEREGAEIHYNLGLDALRGGRQQEALREFEESLRLDDGLAEAHLGRGLVYESYGKASDAERDYRKAISLRPDFSEAHNNLGQLLARAGRYDDAIREFDLALGNMLYREPFIARCNKGQALYRAGRRDEGVAEIRSCLALAPRYCQGHRELGRIQLEEGQTRDALASLGRYAEFCEKAPDAWFQLGLARMKAGEPEKAREAFEKCEEVGGGDPLARECRQKAEALR